MIENVGAAGLRFEPAERDELHQAVTAIQVRGARLPNAVLAYSNVEAPAKP